MIVIDASAVLEIVKQTPAGLGFESSLKGNTLHAPHLIDLEVVQVLRRWVLRTEIPERVAAELLQRFMEMPINRYSHKYLLPNVWQLRNNVTAYDAAYLVLARALGSELLTMDRALRKLATFL